MTWESVEAATISSAKASYGSWQNVGKSSDLLKYNRAINLVYVSKN
jgi:hypothetical protein